MDIQQAREASTEENGWEVVVRYGRQEKARVRLGI